MASFCALCGTSISFFSKGELTCCGESQNFCSTCYESLYDLNHFERTRILLERGRPVNPEKMRPLLEQYDKEQAAKKIREEEVAANAYSELTCLRCGIPMRNLGKRFFHTSHTPYADDSPATRYTQYENLEFFLLRCDKCGKTEFISEDSILKFFSSSWGLEDNLVECPVCGALRDPNGGCPRCAMNNAADRISTAPRAAKKAKPGEKPPWEK